ncbi:DNA adenine methylase [Yunchengibacter salinarum]|uniref:DNA adenine methylase n=1 Tax=Yunchengibacter salinarum TaxID=3133399 RepID=UPI0035B59E23
MILINKGSTKLSARHYPKIVKYMGSKSKIINFLIEGVNEVYDGGTVCDLFSGSATLAGAIGQQCKVHSNDIQSYSRIISDTYNLSYHVKYKPSAVEILDEVKKIVERNRINKKTNFEDIQSKEEFLKFEDDQKNLINENFNYKWHLFAKYYSGTWWSYDQCLWIDALREFSEYHRNTPYYPVLISAIMYAMAYCSQGTGHYAQYRDAHTASSLKDILIYRQRSISDYFYRKYIELSNFIPKSPPKTRHESTTLNYEECLKKISGGTVYADPPYCFVHYSRFYHALETLVLYDYPSLQKKGGRVVKGRYRDDRHQSPFCIKTQVPSAFERLFSGVKESGSKLVLSYSNTGMITIDFLLDMAKEFFKDKKIKIITTDHRHMTLGRKEDRHRDVQECLILIK